MTNQPSSKFDRLIAMLGNDLDCTGTEIADSLWLLILQNQKSAEEKSAVISPPLQTETDKLPIVEHVSSPISQTSIPSQPVSSVGVHSPHAPESSNPPSRAKNTLPIKTPDANSLRNTNEIIRALSSLRQKIPWGREIINEQKTAESTAEQDLPIPVFDLGRELPFDLALVVEKTNSMLLWRQIIQELEELLKKRRLFRDVQVWELGSDDQTKIYLRRGIGQQAGDRQYNPSQLDDLSGRRLIWLVSDCVSSIWYGKEILLVLETWVKHNPVAILQMLPESMWLRTGLSSGTKVLLGSSTLGAANRKLFSQEVLLWNINLDRGIKDLDTGIKIPVSTLQPEMLETWSKMLMCKGNTSARGFIFTLSDSDEKLVNNKQLLPGKERADRFLMTASRIAQDLACLLAAAPVITLPIVRIIQHTLLPRSQQIHVAEVFLGGILKPKPLSPITSKTITSKTNPDEVEYIFIDDDATNAEIRDILLENSLTMNSFRVIDAVSAYFAEKLGDESLKGFYALLKKPEKLEEEIAEAKKAGGDRQERIENFDLKRFAKITARVLKRLGGEYQLFAEEMERDFRVEPGENDDSTDHVPLIELKSFDFEFATIILIDDSINLQTFNFKVGFIKVNQDDNNEPDILEIINRELFNQKNRYLNDIEQLVIKGTLENQTYKQILESQNRSESENHLKSISKKLWNLLTDVFSQNVNKSNVKSVVEQWVNSSPGKATGFIEILDNNIQLEMMLIPGGNFAMGSPPDELERYKNESPQHNVTVQPFFFGKYPVTQAQWKFVARLPQVKVKLKPDPSHFKGVNRPVENVSWDDAVEFCDRLSSHTKKSYRLPSEAEWEYACRAGTTTPFHFGETISTDLANYNGNYIYGNGVEGIYRQETTDVGSFGITNNFGLYDMHGNVLEWCQDQYRDSYVGAPTDGSTWLGENDNQIRMLRGGSWLNGPVVCRSACRSYLVAGGRNDSFGFRVVCSGART